MMETINNEITHIKLNDFVGRCCISIYDGNRVFNAIRENIENDKTTHISFEDVEIVTPTFLNNCIGQLYDKFTSDDLNKHIKLFNMSDSDMYILKKVITNAKNYYSEQKG